MGADLEPGTIMAAYRNGLFPMPVETGLMAWWSPQPRGVLPLDGLRVSRSLRRSCARFEVRVDTAFRSVVAGCADRARSGHWITDEIATAYLRLHQLGWAHSVEAWSLDDGCLAGGLYGIATGGLFAGESMFHRRTDASKVALVALVELLGGAAGAAEGRLLDVQWRTDHLGSLGVVEVDRATYRQRLARALTLPLPPAFA
ncbi:MAG: Leucyl/phenylalanyl-tRNA--protein transferase [uncultured Acidimicrobiales bacterium]|uniref:Leucyl/phenylalanyl-tRNA--protein transferase n=1 Tax=uncultured Acidimicrobiales bacterium TaxID=310071 RepID=A0A6J4HP81_9ACTN|nr:MAG: Leucyl/phenylalanyl-tRNA--protein transferase [uncultured Acidimicrobiales bacterium]